MDVANRQVGHALDDSGGTHTQCRRPQRTAAAQNWGQAVMKLNCCAHSSWWLQRLLFFLLHTVAICCCCCCTHLFSTTIPMKMKWKWKCIELQWLLWFRCDCEFCSFFCCCLFLFHRCCFLSLCFCFVSRFCVIADNDKLNNSCCNEHRRRRSRCVRSHVWCFSIQTQPYE